MIYRLPIDTKSLYLNVRNDNEAGHTATVATPLKQGSSYKKELGQIMNIPENIDAYSRENLVSCIISKSRAEVTIPKICLFDRVSVNGELVDTDCSYCIYVREEISIENVHCGRQKVHYPISLTFSDESVCINNKKIIKAVSEKLANYAFLVNAFEYDTETKILNFDITIVGPENIPYSRVFINQRGAGSKYIKSCFECFDSYDVEIGALRERLGSEKANVSTYSDIMMQCRLSAIELVKHRLLKIGLQDIKSISIDYPDALYDIEYKYKAKKKYVLIYYTSTRIKKFIMSIDRINFFNTFPKDSEIALVLDVLGDARLFMFSADKFADMRKQIRSLSIDASGVLVDG